MEVAAECKNGCQHAKDIGMEEYACVATRQYENFARSYVVWSNEHAAWWGPKHCGYYTHLSSAGRYTRDEALRICRGARGGRAFNENPSEIPILLMDAEQFWTEDGLEERRKREHEERARESAREAEREDDAA